MTTGGVTYVAGTIGDAAGWRCLSDETPQRRPGFAGAEDLRQPVPQHGHGDEDGARTR